MYPNQSAAARIFYAEEFATGRCKSILEEALPKLQPATYEDLQELAGGGRPTNPRCSALGRALHQDLPQLRSDLCAPLLNCDPGATRRWDDLGLHRFRTKIFTSKVLLDALYLELGHAAVAFVRGVWKFTRRIDNE